ncbi:hypothetical protein GW755_02760 [bacterium]|nr:hypothetical protein [bacterium]
MAFYREINCFTKFKCHLTLFNIKILSSFKKYTYDDNTNAYDFYLQNKENLEKFYSVIPKEFYTMVEEEVLLALNSDLACNKSHFVNIMRKVVHVLVEIPALAQELYDLSKDKSLKQEKFLSSLLHDLGHFQQYLTIQSFNNFKYDHCIEGDKIFVSKIAKKELKIESHLEKIISSVIVEHGLTFIESQDPEKVKCIYFLRDIDKISAIEAWDRNQRKVIETDKNGWGLLKKGYSEDVVRIFLSSSQIDYKYRKTTADAMICYLAFIFDFYYKESLQLVLKNGYLNNIINCIPPFLDEKDLGIIRLIKDHIRDYARKILSSN